MSLMPNTDELISVIIPVYNVEKYLIQCVQSVIDQSFSNLEIILVNDGSTDNSLNLCKELNKQDDRIVLVDQKNTGLSGARNAGIDISTGAYITFLDSDDWLNSDAIGKSYHTLKLFNVDLVFWQMVKEFDNRSVNFEGPFKENTLFEFTNFTRLHRRLAGPIGYEKAIPNHIDAFASAWGKLYKSKIIKDNDLKFVDTKVVGSEDIPFNFEYFYYAKSAYYLHEFLIHYRKDNLTSLTKNHGSTLFPRFLQLFEYLSYFIDEKKLPMVFRVALNNRIAISTMNIGLSEISPRNSNSSSEKIKNLNSYFNNPTYIGAYKALTIKEFPIHWKFFYFACKIKSGLLAFMILKGMRLFINK